MTVVAGRSGGVERWVTSPRAYAALVRAGTEPATARAWVAAAVAQYGHRWPGTRPGYLPAWLARDLVDLARRLAAGETLDEIAAEE